MATKSRPALGNHSVRLPRPPRPSYVAEPAPKQVSRGSVSKPKPLPKWRPKVLPQDRPGKIVQR